MYEEIIKFYPELKDSQVFINGIIILQDDSDGIGSYIKVWNYDKPIPDGMKLGKN